jgi:hypothetical protein
MKDRALRSDVFADDFFGLSSCRFVDLLAISTSAISLAIVARSVAAPRMAEAEAWWSQTGSNRRPHACKARALPAELWPRFSETAVFALVVAPRAAEGEAWWAWEDLNFRPHAYQARALTN